MHESAIPTAPNDFQTAEAGEATRPPGKEPTENETGETCAGLGGSSPEQPGDDSATLQRTERRQLEDQCWELERRLDNEKWDRQRDRKDAELKQTSLRRELDAARERNEKNEAYFKTQIKQAHDLLAEEKKAHRQTFASNEKLAAAGRQLEAVALSQISDARAATKRAEMQLLESRARNTELSDDYDWMCERMRESDEEISCLEKSTKSLAMERDQWKAECQKERSLREKESARRAFREKEILSLNARLGMERARAKVEIGAALEPVFAMLRCGLACEDPEEAKQLFAVSAQRFYRVVPEGSVVREEAKPMTARQAARFLKIAKATLREVPATELPYTLTGKGGLKRHRRYRRDDLLRYLGRGT